MTRKPKKILASSNGAETQKPPPSNRLYLEEHLKAKGWSDAIAAEKFGVAYATMYRYRKSQRELNVGKIAKFAEVLGVTPQELWQPPGDDRSFQIVAQLRTLNPEQRDLVVRMIQQFFLLNVMKPNEK